MLQVRQRLPQRRAHLRAQHAAPAAGFVEGEVAHDQSLDGRTRFTQESFGERSPLQTWERQFDDELVTDRCDQLLGLLRVQLEAGSNDHESLSVSGPAAA